jgi:hypothetical protein
MLKASTPATQLTLAVTVSSRDAASKLTALTVRSMIPGSPKGRDTLRMRESAAPTAVGPASRATAARAADAMESVRDRARIGVFSALQDVATSDYACRPASNSRDR